MSRSQPKLHKVVSSRDNKFSALVNKYAKGSTDFSTNNLKHKKLRKTLEESKERNFDAAKRTAATEILLPAEAGFIEVENNEKVYKFSQKEILQNVDLNT